MKTEDIDKKIGMPDVNDEWAKFESEVINKEEAAPRKSRRPLYIWMGGIGIAASLLLLFVLNMKDELAEEPLLTAQTMIAEGVIEETTAEETTAEETTAEETTAEETTAEETAKKDIVKVPSAQLIAQVKSYEQNSDSNRMTGIDDDREEEVRPSGTPRRIEMREYEGLGYTSIDEALQGRIAGLDVVENAGNLGSGNNVRLRGTSEMSSSGDDSPLIVLNGEALNLRLDDEVLKHATDKDFLRILRLEGQTVESIRVLKDATATAVYGRQGWNGVIEITTKPIKTLPDSLIAKVKAYEKKSDPKILVGRDHGKIDMSKFEGLEGLTKEQLQGRIAGLKIVPNSSGIVLHPTSQRSEKGVSDVKIIGSDSIGNYLLMLNYEEGRKLAERLQIPIDSASESWKEKHRQYELYNKVRARLLMPKHATFGLGCEPSRSKEWSLCYDSIAHALIYCQADTNIWWTARKALYKTEKDANGKLKIVRRKHPKSMRKVKVKTYSMPITDKQMHDLNSFWKDAIKSGDKKKAFLLDNRTCEISYGELRVSAPNGINPFVTFNKKLVESVCSNDAVRRDSLLAESTLRKCLTDMNEAMRPIQFKSDSLIIVVNKHQLHDSLCKQIRHRPKQYYHQCGLLVSQIRQWSPYGAKWYSGYDEACQLWEFQTVVDTLSDTYVGQHPERQKYLRHVSGVVLDEKEKPISDVWVGVYGEGAGAPTDSKGRFSFWLPRDKDKLYAECLGYVTQENIQILDSAITIHLKSSITLRDVKVMARNRKYGLPIPHREVTGKINMEDFEGIMIKIDEVEDNTKYVVPSSQIAPIIKKSSKKSQPKSITFKVDENLKDLEKTVVAHYDGRLAAQYLLGQDGIKVEDQHVVALSFADAQNLRIVVKDAFYQCMVKAYAEHKSVTLSPDMMWLLISQGFARYVNAHSEELRSQLVYHEGKQDLMVMTKDDLLSGKADWGKLLNDFSKQIERHTKGEVAKTIAADFSTTTPVERIASQITLMESMKSYFNYLAGRIGCGIPSVTLQGTPDDWRAVLSKTQKLGQYGLSEWTQTLEPILNEFIKTAEGNPNQRFWQEMVKKQRVDEFASARPCSADKPTELDGWILKFFPTEAGYTLDRVPYTKSMPAEFVRVEFKYRVIDPITGATLSETPMELMSGFIGALDDEKNNMLTPQIGWLVRARE
jgi:TonB-dependent SusC/RagA subfamily outer membrane receptor